MSEPKKMWVVKYWSTTGIFEHTAEEEDRYVWLTDVAGAKMWNCGVLVKNRDIVDTKEEAIARARKLAEKKAESLRKQLKKVEALAKTPKFKKAGS
jgi:hypothetical protein